LSLGGSTNKLSKANIHKRNTTKNTVQTISGVCKTFSELYHKTNKIEDTNKLNIVALKIIGILHNTLLATFI
jgi:hypothetical protein